MAHPEMVQALNDQIREELESSYVYLGLSAELEALNLTGAAAWFRKQSDEERGHAMKLYEFLNDLGASVVLQALGKPPIGTKTLKDAFTKALAHEKHITASIHNLVRLARKLDDIATENFLMWFVAEQIEEEKTASDILAKIDMVGTSAGSQFLIDRDLGKAAAKSSD